MGDKSKIEWTDATWNPVTGCTKISPGCKHCYAEVFAERWRGIPGHPYEQGFDLKLHPGRLDQPLRWKKPRMIFVNSMSDLFHEKIEFGYLKKIFSVMYAAHWHTFQILTKRAHLLHFVRNQLFWPDNVWIGVSVESEKYVGRIGHLRSVPAAIRFLSLEPLLGPLSNLHLNGIDWVIVGGESGPGARPMHPVWVRDIRDQCIDEGVPFFFKQWGGVRKKQNGRVLDGRTWSEMPDGKKTFDGEHQYTLSFPA